MFGERINNWKQIIAGFGIFGFILSIITGLIGDVLFGAVMLRAVIFAVIFGGIGFVVLFIADRFIPELFFAESDSDLSDSGTIIEDGPSGQESAESVSGRNLDITVEDGDFEELEEVGGDESSSDTVSATGGSDTAEVELAEEVEDGEVEELQEAEEPQTEGEEKKQKKKGSEELPDISAFSDSFESSADESENSEGLSSIDGLGGAEIMGDMHDTQEIVKAVQTVLKKDQEG